MELFGIMVKIYCDGASKGNPGPASLGVWATDEDGDGNSGEPVFEISEDIGRTTNNQAEWRSVLRGLQEAVKREDEVVEVYMDSELVVRQIKGIYKVKKPEFKPYWEEAQSYIKKFKKFSIQHIPRELNKKADALANLAIKP